MAASAGVAPEVAGSGAPACRRRRRRCMLEGARQSQDLDDTRESMERCITITLAKRRPFGDITGAKRKRSTRRRTPELMEEIITEILLRLPVKSLVRCRSVSKAWRAIISDPIFIQAHLRRSAARWEQNPSFIICPHTLDYISEDDRRPTVDSTHLRFYQWQWQPGASSSQQAATFIHEKDLFAEFTRVHNFSHCDGLVFAPTNFSLHVFNPATREAIRLPDSRRNRLRRGGRACSHSAGLGLDPRTGKYKVVQPFYHSSKDLTRMGMEVFTIETDDAHDGSWSLIEDDPPYPVHRYQTALHINGFMFWQVAKQMNHLEQPPRAIVHLCLEDEEFGVTRLPRSLDPALDDDIQLSVLLGRELCLIARTSETRLTIWTLPIVEDGLHSLWLCRYCIQASSLFYPMILPCFSSDIILARAQTVYRYNLVTNELTALCEMDRMRYQGHRARKWKDLAYFNLIPYTESLIRITKSRP